MQYWEAVAFGGLEEVRANNDDGATADADETIAMVVTVKNRWR